jgi:cysteinyl-tRNA synthetase
MSFKHLGVNFDIHGGGADLMFPHHENEIAQSRCAAPGSRFANYWIHNGFLTVYGEKMSKSLGNFKTVRELIETGIDGSVIRYFYLTAHYKKPLDLTEKALEDARKSMHKLSNAFDKVQDGTLPQQSDEILNYLCDDMNTAGAIAHLQMLASKVSQGDMFYAPQMVWGMNLLGLKPLVNQIIIPDEIKKLADDRLNAKKNKNWSLADELRVQIERGGYRILDEANSYRLERIIL